MGGERARSPLGLLARTASGTLVAVDEDLPPLSMTTSTSGTGIPTMRGEAIGLGAMLRGESGGLTSMANAAMLADAAQASPRSDTGGAEQGAAKRHRSGSGGAGGSFSGSGGSSDLLTNVLGGSNESGSSLAVQEAHAALAIGGSRSSSDSSSIKAASPSAGMSALSGLGQGKTLPGLPGLQDMPGDAAPAATLATNAPPNLARFLVRTDSAKMRQENNQARLDSILDERPTGIGASSTIPDPSIAMWEVGFDGPEGVSSASAAGISIASAPLSMLGRSMSIPRGFSLEPSILGGGGSGGSGGGGGGGAGGGGRCAAPLQATLPGPPARANGGRATTAPAAVESGGGATTGKKRRMEQ